MGEIVEQKILVRARQAGKHHEAMETFERMVTVLAENCEVAGYLLMAIRSAGKRLTASQMTRLCFEIMPNAEDETLMDGFIFGYRFTAEKVTEILRLETIGLQASNVVDLFDPVKRLVNKSILVGGLKHYESIVFASLAGAFVRDLVKNPSKALSYSEINDRAAVTMRRRNQNGCLRLTLSTRL